MASFDVLVCILQTLSSLAFTGNELQKVHYLRQIFEVYDDVLTDFMHLKCLLSFQIVNQFGNVTLSFYYSLSIHRCFYHSSHCRSGILQHFRHVCKVVKVWDFGLVLYRNIDINFYDNLVSWTMFIIFTQCFGTSSSRMILTVSI